MGFSFVATAATSFSSPFLVKQHKTTSQ